MPPLEATPWYNWCHKKEELRLLRDLRNRWANHFRWMDVYRISRSGLFWRLRQILGQIFCCRMGYRGPVCSLTKENRRRGGQVEEAEGGYLFNYHLATAAYVWTGNPISRLPAILGLWATCPVTSRVYYLRLYGYTAWLCYPVTSLIIFLIAKII